MTAKTYSYLTNNNNEDKKAKSTKEDVIKRKLKFEDCKHCLEAKEKNRVEVDNLREYHAEVIRNNNLKS